VSNLNKHTQTKPKPKPTLICSQHSTEQFW